MKRTTMKTAGVLLCSLSLVLAGTSSSEACLLSWLFGCHCHRPCPPAAVPTFYAPACPTVCPSPCPPAAPPVQTFYAPACGAPTFAPAGVTAGYAPASAHDTAGYAPLDYGARYTPLDYGARYAPLDYGARYAPVDYGVSYAPVDYGVGYGPVDYGTAYGPVEYSAGFGPYQHGAGYGPADSCASGMLPPPSNGEPRTFGNGQPPRAPGADDSQFAPREEREGYRPTAPPESKGDYNDKDAEETSSSPRRDTLRIDDMIPETIIPRRQPAPAKPPVEGSSSERKIAVRPLGLDHKITWRTTPVRTRLVRQSKVETPMIARTKADPNAGWLPVSSEAKVARK